MKRLVPVVLAMLATPALGGDEPEFTGPEFVMPSRNIACRVQDVSLEGGSGASKRLFCQRIAPTTLAVILGEGGLESYSTIPDAQVNWHAPMLGYGQNWWHDGFACDSAKSGLLCSHGTYGTFTLSRKGVEELK